MTREQNETILLHCWHGIFTVNVTFLKPQNIILLKNWQLRGSQLHEWRRMDTSFHDWPLFIDKYKSPIQFHIYSHKIISYTNISHGKINKQEKTHFISVTYFGRTFETLSLWQSTYCDLATTFISICIGWDIGVLSDGLVVLEQKCKLGKMVKSMNPIFKTKELIIIPSMG